MSTASKIPSKVAILFSGGPAPAANAVISAAAVSFLRHRPNPIPVVGIKHGYSNLVKFDAKSNPMVEGKHYIDIEHADIKRTRNSQGILIGTSRENPGKKINKPADLDDATATAPLRCVYEALRSIGVDALVSIGGDDTLKTANKFKLFQEKLPKDQPRISVVHLPKTIDNDYYGIDFTFGFFTAVNMLGEEIRNLIYDADASRSYFLTECMGRSAGWLAYGAAITGEASLVLSVEDIEGPLADEEVAIDDKEQPIRDEHGQLVMRKIMKLDKVIDRIVQTMLARERDGKEYGVIVVAEGLAELLPAKELIGIPRDPHGHIAVAEVGLGEKLSTLVTQRYKELSGGKTRKVKGLQLGYEARCARPIAFDAMLGSQLGVGAYRALVQEKKNGVMVSVEGQLELRYVDFEELVDQKTLVTKVRHINPDSDFYKLARFLETHV